ncbi:MAG TPA: hypothetical protein VK674_00155 [Candidatus Limnocylindria bacterium]|nr:hypothetical protein [Candidatus Limnocylindria bacterium]
MSRGKPLQLKIEGPAYGIDPAGAGDIDPDVIGFVKGPAGSLGRYALCPHVDQAIELINQSLVEDRPVGKVADEIGAAIEAGRYHLGRCAVKPFLPTLQAITS